MLKVSSYNCQQSRLCSQWWLFFVIHHHHPLLWTTVTHISFFFSSIPMWFCYLSPNYVELCQLLHYDDKGLTGQNKPAKFGFELLNWWFYFWWGSVCSDGADIHFPAPLISARFSCSLLCPCSKVYYRLVALIFFRLSHESKWEITFDRDSRKFWPVLKLFVAYHSSLYSAV